MCIDIHIQCSDLLFYLNYIYFTEQDAVRLLFNFSKQALSLYREYGGTWMDGPFLGGSEEDSPSGEILHFSILSADCVRLFHRIEIGEEK